MDERKLDEAEMSEVSKAWVTTESAARAVIEKTPMMAPLLPTLEQVHAAIVAVAAQSSDPEIQQLTLQGKQLDIQHDDLLRGMFGALTTLAKLAKNGDQVRSLRNQLFPLGLSHNNKSHLAEAGHAAAVAAAMTDDQLTFLKSLPLGDSTMFDLYNQWQSVSTQMGAVEEKRALLKHPSKTLAAQTQAARREWIRWTKILVTTAENAGINPADDALLFAPLREAMQKADDRWSNSPKPTPPAPAP